VQHTETLKLLFVLYFRILKHPRPTPLLPAALRGISKFAHLINIDFFKDLLQVLKDLILRDAPGENPSNDSETFVVDATTDIQHRLLCIVTAFELLSGQGSSFIQIIYSNLLNAVLQVKHSILTLPISSIIYMPSYCRSVYRCKSTRLRRVSSSQNSATQNRRQSRTCFFER